MIIELPEQWKESIIVQIYKKGDKSDSSNYQRISLLTTSYKISYNILLLRINPYVDNIIRDLQYDKRSTTDQMFCIHKILEKNECTTQEYIMYL